MHKIKQTTSADILPNEFKLVLAQTAPMVGGPEPAPTNATTYVQQHGKKLPINAQDYITAKVDDNWFKDNVNSNVYQVITQNPSMKYIILSGDFLHANGINNRNITILLVREAGNTFRFGVIGGRGSDSDAVNHIMGGQYPFTPTSPYFRSLLFEKPEYSDKIETPTGTNTSENSSNKNQPDSVTGKGDTAIPITVATDPASASTQQDLAKAQQSIQSCDKLITVDPVSKKETIIPDVRQKLESFAQKLYNVGHGKSGMQTVNEPLTGAGNPNLGQFWLHLTNQEKDTNLIQYVYTASICKQHLFNSSKYFTKYKNTNSDTDLLANNPDVQAFFINVLDDIQAYLKTIPKINLGKPTINTTNTNTTNTNTTSLTSGDTSVTNTKSPSLPSSQPSPNTTSEPQIIGH